MEVIFWGTRGSWPLVGAASSSFLSHHSPCVELRLEQSLILDAGSALGPALRHSFESGKREFHILLSHFHWDHLLGLLSIYDLFSQGIKLNIYSAHEEVEKRVLSLFQECYCPISQELIRNSFCFKIVRDKIRVGEFDFRFCEIPHVGTTFAFEVRAQSKRVVYMSDVDLSLLESSPFEGGPDLLICDSFHLVEDKKLRGSWGHSSAKEAVEFAESLTAKSLALFHYSPTYSINELKKIHQEALSAKKI